MLNTCRNKFNLKEFSLKVDEPQVFLTCQWQENKLRPSIWYFIYRWLVSIYFLATWLLSILDVKESDPAWYQAKYPIYLTNWGYTLCTLQALLAAIMLTFSIIPLKKSGFRLTPVLKIYKLYWLMNAIATPVAFVITVIYWTAIYDPKSTELEVLNVIVHGMNSVVMLFDFWMLSHPVRFIHFFYPVIFATFYVIFSVIYYLAGGTSREGTTYIYPILDWSNVPKSILVCCIVALFAIFVHIVVYCMYLCRKTIFNKLIRDRKAELTINMTERNMKSGYVNQAVIMGDEV